MKNKAKPTNLAEVMQRDMPPYIAEFIRLAGEASEKRQQRLYLAGGAVRDLLLGRPVKDVDLVVEGDGIALADELSPLFNARTTAHKRFGTATLKMDGFSADIATARAESYSRPGALPSVKPATRKEDLARRDFTVNAMALELNPKHYGELLDPYGGAADLKNGLVRVLHEQSFVDDPTRIWRAVRYEQRLGFKIEPFTLLLLLERDLPGLENVSGNRVRREMEMVLAEAEPENALRRAAELGLLEQVHPAMAFGEETAVRFRLARERYEGHSPLPPVYLALLCYPLNQGEIQRITEYLRTNRQITQVLSEIPGVKSRLEEMERHGPAPSSVYAALSGYGLPVLMAAALANDAATAEQIDLYLNVLRHVKPALTGSDLLKMGVPEGPRIRELLNALREARLDGQIGSKAEEEELVKSLTATGS